MTKKITTISVLVISIVLVSLYVISSTYSVLINVIDNDGKSEIIDRITIRDILIGDDGNYNSLYYDVKRELSITYEEGEMLINSVLLNNVFETILNDVVGYRLYNRTRMSNDEIYNLVVSNIKMDNNITSSVKDKVINKLQLHIDDIVNYVYDFDVSTVGVLS